MWKLLWWLMVVAFWDWVILDARFIFFLKISKSPLSPYPPPLSKLIMLGQKLPSWEASSCLVFKSVFFFVSPKQKVKTSNSLNLNPFFAGNGHTGREAGTLHSPGWRSTLNSKSCAPDSKLLQELQTFPHSWQVDWVNSKLFPLLLLLIDAYDTKIVSNTFVFVFFFWLHNRHCQFNLMWVPITKIFLMILSTLGCARNESLDKYVIYIRLIFTLSRYLQFVIQIPQ